MNNVVIGVDPGASKCAAVVLDDDGYKIHVLYIKEKDAPTRTLKAFRWIRKLVVELDCPVTVFIEKPVFTKGRLQSLITLGEMQGALLAGAASAGATVGRVGPTEWKKSVVGNGHASKVKVLNYLRKAWLRFYLESDGDVDIADAGAIALFGRKQAGAKQGMNKDVGRTRRSPGVGPSRTVRGRSSVGKAPRTGVPALVKNSISK